MKKFKADSQRVLQLMVNSIYTNKEIFLRELISNASDALDKAKFASITDSSITGEFFIEVKVDKEQRSITISDSGIGMDEKELESNLGTIAQSGTEKFKAENITEEQLIGQFGVGFYSAFMVAKKIEVISKPNGGAAHRWTSDGTGYEIKAAEKEGRGTQITLYLMESGEDFDYDTFLYAGTIKRLIKKYSDYIRYPIYANIEVPSDDGKEVKTQREVLNSMTPIWKKGKDATKEETDAFYQNKYFALTPPIKTVPVYMEGNISYHALLFFPSKRPLNFYTVEYERGLSLYSSGVMIMENCKELLPEYLGFVRGVVDSDDLSLNISREMLQKTRQLDVIAKSIEKKILSVMEKMLQDQREEYEQLFSEVGAAFKFGIYNNYGMKKDELKDLILFYSSTEKKLVTLKEYTQRLEKDDDNILYAAGESIEAIKRQPIVRAFMEKGREVLFLTDHIDEFVIKILDNYEEKPIKSVNDKDVKIDQSQADPQQEELSRFLLDKIKEALGEKVSKVTLSNKLPDSSAAVLTSANDISIEMEKVLNQSNKDNKLVAEYVLEINPRHKIFDQLKQFEDDKDSLRDAAIVVYYQAALVAGIPLGEVDEFITAINNFVAAKDNLKEDSRH